MQCKVYMVEKLSHVVSIRSPAWDLNFINAFGIVILLSYTNIDIETGRELQYCYNKR